MDNVAEQIARLAQALLQGAAKLGIQAKTAGDSIGPLVVLRCRDAAALVTQLAASGVVCSSRHDGLRLSFHVYNTIDDVQAVLEVLEKNLELMTKLDEVRAD